MRAAFGQRRAADARGGGGRGSARGACRGERGRRAEGGVPARAPVGGATDRFQRAEDIETGARTGGLGRARERVGLASEVGGGVLVLSRLARPTPRRSAQAGEGLDARGAEQ